MSPSAPSAYLDPFLPVPEATLQCSPQTGPLSPHPTSPSLNTGSLNTSPTSMLEVCRVPCRLPRSLPWIPAGIAQRGPPSKELPKTQLTSAFLCPRLLGPFPSTLRESGLSHSGAEVQQPPEPEGVFTPKDKAGNSLEYNRTYCRATDVQEDRGGAQQPAPQPRRCFSAARPLTAPCTVQLRPWGRTRQRTGVWQCQGPCTSSWSHDR